MIHCIIYKQSDTNYPFVPFGFTYYVDWKTKKLPTIIQINVLKALGNTYCMSKQSCLFLYNQLLFKNGQCSEKEREREMTNIQQIRAYERERQTNIQKIGAYERERQTNKQQIRAYERERQTNIKQIRAYERERKKE